MVGGRLATLVTLFSVAVLAFVATTRATLDKRFAHHHHRVTGFGQIRFDGFGPEAWALRARHEQHLTVVLRRLLSTRIDRLVYLVGAFQCIHSHEGSWSANTGNGYYGGLQMDLGFQGSYGRELLSSKGTANQWTPSEQIAVAISAYASRGFSPWPNTARMCGLP